MNQFRSRSTSTWAFKRAVWRDASEIIVDSTWTARSLQKAAARWASTILVLGLPANVIAKVTGAGAGAASDHAPVGRLEPHAWP
jgi:hypothetical protein